MRRLDKQIKDEKIINDILLKSKICRIALFDKEYPYIVPMNYGYYNNALYFHCAQKGKKIELIRKNNNAGFEIEQGYEILKHDISCKWTTKYRSIFGQGKIEIISDFEKKQEGLDIIMQHHGKYNNEYNKNNIRNIFVLKLEIENITAKQSGIWE